MMRCGRDLEKIKIFPPDPLMTPQHYSDQSCPKFQNIQPAHMDSYYSVIIQSYDHPKHVEVLKHLVCIKYECGTQSEGGFTQAWHHNTSFRPILPRFTKIWHCTSFTMPPYVHPQHIKVIKHFFYVYYECGMQSVWACSLNYHDTTTPLRPPTCPNFPKFGSTVNRCSVIRVVHPYPYTHPQHNC